MAASVVEVVDFHLVVCAPQAPSASVYAVAVFGGADDGGIHGGESDIKLIA